MVLKPVAILKAEAQEEHRETLAAAERLALRCRTELSASAAYLFGSRARNDWHRNSDADIFIVSDRFAGMKPWERWSAIAALWDGPVDLQPVGVTAEEWQAAKAKGGLVTMALADGIVVL